MNLVVTGSSSGIGRGLTLRLLGRGHRVWGLARSDQTALEGPHKGQFRSSLCDVAQWDAVERAAREVAESWAHVDGLVTCAGLQGEIGRAVRAEPARWSATVRANLDGSFHAIRAFFDLLSRAPRRAKIVCFSGGGATKARPRFSAYAAAKTAVVRLVETIAEEEKSAALDINAVAPGAIHTRLTEEVLALGPRIAGEAEYQAALKQKAEAGAPLGRALDLVEWLLSAESDGISGRLLSAPWDPWPGLARNAGALSASDVYTLRRIVPEDRGLKWQP
ncbi:MAG TPA: SDR family oxidoreductase [Opitutaceae bacterium]|nr:SDR family oxidoreductase [Opitutaceae bacterium]